MRGLEVENVWLCKLTCEESFLGQLDGYFFGEDAAFQGRCLGGCVDFYAGVGA